MNQENHFIDSAACVQKELKKEGIPVPKVNVVRNILKKDLGMSYRKVNPIAWTANSHRNLILRQQFALAYLGLDLEKKIVLSVDQSWCSMADFRRSKWCEHRHNNSVP